MSTTPSNIINVNPWEGNMDFAALRLAAIAFLEEHNPTLWTDYNYHDPGVTILEQFCFALTDLAYRTDFCMADLLQKPDNAVTHAFPGVFSLLNSFPVLKKDIRKVILDSLQLHGHEKGKISDKIYNAWVMPESNGPGGDSIYLVEVQVTSQVYKNIAGDKRGPDAPKKELEKEIIRALGNFRGLCTDFGEVKILDGDEIRVTGNVNIKNGYVPEKVLADIYTQIDAFINPNVPFYSLTQLLDQGLTVDKIFEGPALNRGFILDDGLIPRRTEIDVSDIESIIFKTDGVSAIANIRINAKADIYELKKDHFPFLKTDILKHQHGADNLKGDRLEVSKNGARIAAPSLNVRAYNTYLSQFNAKRAKPSADQTVEKSFQIPGKFRDIGKYYSIQKYFPTVYGIGDYGLPDKVFVNEAWTDTPQTLDTRKAQSLQLKAYLMLFEQMLANYLSQMANLDHLFSAGHRPVGQTYFGQSIVDQISNIKSNNVPNGIDVIGPDNLDNYVNAITDNAEDHTTYLNRREMFLDHLLARVNEKLDSYPFTLYETVYGAENNSKNGEPKRLAAKAKYLNMYGKVGYERNKAFNYHTAHTANDINVSGLELKMCLLLGIDNYERRELHQLKKFTIVDRQEDITKKKRSETDIVYADIEVFTEVTVEELFDGGEMVVETIEEDEVVVVEGAVKEAPADENQGFRFDNVTSAGVEAFFKNGMALSGYRIGRHKNKKNGHEYFVTFFNMSADPTQHDWKKIHTHTTEAMAKRKLGKLIAYVKKINTGSEGFHLIEHVLLRDGNPNEISVVLPLWPARFQDTGFQEYVQQLFTRQAPLYVKINFVWLDIIYMKTFEALYFPWLKSLEGGNKTAVNKTAKPMIEFLKENSGKHRR